MTEKPRETQAESHVVELKEKVNNSSLMKHRKSTGFTLLSANLIRVRKPVRPPCRIVVNRDSFREPWLRVV